MRQIVRVSIHEEPRGAVAIARHYIRDLIYGANDGLITTFAVVAAVSGGALSTRTVLIVGMANLAADGLSMGVGNYLSIRSHESALTAEGRPEEEASPARHGIATFLAFVVAEECPVTLERPLFIVMNTGAGSRDATSTEATVRGVLAQAGRRHEVWRAHDPRQLPLLTQRAVAQARQQQGIVVAAGGDGTINTVAQAVLKSGCPFGVLPQGTFNYFSRTHGIPLDTPEATRALLASRIQPVHVGLLNDRVFLVNASLGLYPKLLEEREADTQQFGRRRLVAVWAGGVTLLRGHRPLRLRLEHAGEVRVMHTAMLVVGNNPLQLQQPASQKCAPSSRGS